MWRKQEKNELAQKSRHEARPTVAATTRVAQATRRKRNSRFYVAHRPAAAGSRCPSRPWNVALSPRLNVVPSRPIYYRRIRPYAVGEDGIASVVAVSLYHVSCGRGSDHGLAHQSLAGAENYFE